MSKRNISYVKPQDPSFLAKLKAQIGYKDGPTIETKTQRTEQEEASSGDERPEREDEKPQIVVLQSGDLTADEVAREEARRTREEAEAPADLNRRVIFKKRKSEDSSKVPGKKVKEIPKAGGSKQGRNCRGAKLSFNHEEDEDEDNY